MPTIQASPNDSLTGITRFKTSRTFEMLAQIQFLQTPWKDQDWAENTKKILGNEFMRELSQLYDRFNLGCCFMEILIDYPDWDDIKGFLKYIETIDEKTFAFYILGRLYPLEAIPEKPTGESIRELISNVDIGEHKQNNGLDFDWPNELPKIRAELHQLWSHYYYSFFRQQGDELTPMWHQGIREKEEILHRSGGTDLLVSLTDYKTLPPELPVGTAYSTVIYVPVSKLYRRFSMYYGYGQVTVLFDSARTKEKTISIEDSRKQALAICKALGDENRMKILKILYTRTCNCNGKEIAEKLNLSPSVTSRHLKQLKEAGLLTERSPDNRNILYTLNREKIVGLGKQIIDYISD